MFDVIGPNMIGPSSSHTAGACSIALMARKMFQEPVVKAQFTLYGSFARTYEGHGTDRALLGGMMGFETDDRRIKNAFKEADKIGLQYEFVSDKETNTEHPNTVDILMTGATGRTLMVRGESVGGGKIRITRIDDVQVEFTGEYSTMVIRQLDRPGVLVSITTILNLCGVNIAYLRNFRKEKGGEAFTVVESDGPIQEEAVKLILQQKDVQEVMLIPMM